MTPYKALYGRPCRSSICWIEVGKRSITGPNLIRDTLEKVGYEIISSQLRADRRATPIDNINL